MKVAIIPARGGSKRIKDKNIRDFGGQPMIFWAISNAIKSGIFDRIIVSTDSIEVKAIALECGAEVPFIRPAHLSNDLAGTLPVIKHCIDWLEGHDETLSEVCCIYPATPFLEPQDLQKGFRRLFKNDVCFSFSITSYAHPIQRALRINENGLVKMIKKKNSDNQTQDLSEMYHDAGQFYWAMASNWRSESSILSSRASGIIIPRYRAIDIDTWEDWTFAEIIFQAMKFKSVGSDG